MSTSDPQSGYSASSLLKEHPGIALSGVYAIASLIGLIYAWVFMQSFGINVFHFAELSDFFLASLKEPFTWGLTLIAVSLFLLDNLMSRRVQRRGKSKLTRWYGSKRYRQLNYLVLGIIIVSFLSMLAERNADDIYAGKGTLTTVQLADGSAPRDLVILATTGKFIFLFDHAENQTFIHPHENVLTLSRKVVPLEQKGELEKA